MTEVEFILAIRDYHQYLNLKRRVIRKLKTNKLHRKERFKQIVKHKMKHI